MAKSLILDAITAFYLKSHDFNGIPLRTLRNADPSLDEVKELILSGHITIVFGDLHPNPHIRALTEHPPAKQIELLTSEYAENACVYPLPEHLATVVNRAAHIDTPYTLALMLGEPQLTYRSFDLAILEAYRNYPRYYYRCSDIGGRISVRDAHFETGTMLERDQVHLQTFGFSYDDELNKYVSVFLRYLADLSPEHQRLWHVREVPEKTRLHPDYYRSSILGEFPEGGSIYVAFIEEIRIINKMSKAMGRAPLFRNDYDDENRPQDFASLLRPTLREYNNFVLLLDKLLSDNIDIVFFRNDVPSERDEMRPDGKVEVKRIGSLQMLSDWLAGHFTTKDQEPIQEMIETFRNIRKLRQKPAHAISEDSFDQGYVRDQRALMMQAYGAIRTLRLIFANHPSASKVEIPRWLSEGRIWTQ
jgi:hypothetical protein